MIVIIADDITGAAEIAGICIRYGLNTNFCVDEVPAHSDAEVLVIATDSRSLTEEKAVEIHQYIAEKIAKLNPEFIFKKCDSVLRGYVSAEAGVLYQTFHQNIVVVVPVNPLAGRVIKNGKYYLQESLLHQTNFSEDTDFPAFSPDVSVLINKRNKRFSSSCIIPDCEDQASLENLALQYLQNQIFTGSSAWFHEILLYRKKLNRKSPATFNQNIRKFVVFNGSLHPSGKEDAVQYKHRFAIEILPESLFRVSCSEDEIYSYQAYLIQLLHEKKGLFLFQPDVFMKQTKNLIWLIQRTIDIITPILLHEETTYIGLTGGATAYSVFKALGWNSFIPDREIAPGVLSITMETMKNKKIILKPGSYKWGIDF